MQIAKETKITQTKMTGDTLISGSRRLAWSQSQETTGSLREIDSIADVVMGEAGEALPEQQRTKR